MPGREARAVTEQGYPPRQPDYPGRNDRPGSPHESRQGGWQSIDGFAPADESESELPPWAIPGGIEPLRPARRSARTAATPVLDPEPVADDPEVDQPARSIRRPGRSRAAATRRRRSRRRLVTWGSVAVVVVVLAGVGYFVNQQSPPPSRYVSHLLKGEFATVPNTCSVLTTTALTGYLGGQPGKGVQSASGAAKSECTYQFDAKPTFHVLDITVQAYAPSLLAPGDGSATSYAKFTFAQTRQTLAKPPKNTPQPPATIKSVPGLGSQTISALQVYHSAGTLIDKATFVTRFRNVLITTSLWATDGGGFGPVSMSTLKADALSAERSLLASVQSQPTAGS
jgi:hypothetical protein